ncbi:MAG: DUF1638 domain-containing protein [Gammaproteobacteria bacterium]|jgi:hypothetical protein|nr:DUF1638 domain-containing protein [Gammaproteobacteria bacterium]MBT3723393.1 DUF1638 domain-containing protein [Gammaproteobacteria bacterium]MBT4196361.1 DUF1638 domain-containing protein [Gammaproteobacteria bacterium]MBT4452377.1 DUF1638 domain-containing protein [Gammaproteobacteria bacterium]MBT4860050.1 DUF1638 domain-containing protein [Gammaproteobacteria bacterium]
MNNSPRILVITCAAIAREVNEIRKLNHWSHMDLQAISADLHVTPEKIPQAVANKIDQAKDVYDSIFVAYGDCGTSGELDRLLAERGVSRLPGAHCYDFLAGEKTYASLQNEEPGTFYLTDFLTQHFERLVICTLGLDRFPELLPQYFGHYKRLVYLAQTDSTELTELARKAANRLNLHFEKTFTGSGAMLPVLEAKMQMLAGI